MSADIQQARDVLARRRAGTTARQGAGLPVTAAPEDAALIQLVVNPELLDAIDGVLLSALRAGPLHNSTASIRRHGINLAAAIIAADDRMSR